jgi:hypothetical protein
VLAQRRRLGRPVQRRFGEPQQRDDRQDRDRHGQQVGGPRAQQRGQRTAQQRAEDHPSAVHQAGAPELPLERRAVAGLLHDGVVDDGVQGPGVHREEHAERECAQDIGGHVVAEPAEQRAHRERRAGHHEHTAPAPPVGEDPGGNLEQRHDRRVGRGHQADARGGEADPAHEQLLDRHPEAETLQEHGDVQGEQPSPQPAAARRYRSRDGGHGRLLVFRFR